MMDRLAVRYALSRFRGMCETTWQYTSMFRPKPDLSAHTRKPARQSVSLKSLAEHLGLSQAAVSLVINRSPAAKSIPHRTQELIRAAALELNYRPNHLARSLRQQRSYTIGVVVPEISEGYAALVMSGIENHLLQEGYFYFVVSHRHRQDLIEEYPLLLQQRAVEGLIAVDTAFTEGVQVPLVAVSGHRGALGFCVRGRRRTRHRDQGSFGRTTRGRIVFTGTRLSGCTEASWFG